MSNADCATGKSRAVLPNTDELRFGKAVFNPGRYAQLVICAILPSA